MDNLTEGFACRSGKDKCRFYVTSVSSCIEVLSMTYLLRDIKFAESNTILDLRDKVLEVHRLIRALAKSIQDKNENQ